MKLVNKLLDTEFPNIGISHTRIVVRGIIINENNEVALLKINRDDIFGKVTYYETPGGGKKEFETLEAALIREIDEELGYEIKIVQELGLVEDDYNLIQRHNMNYYFLGKTINKTMIHHESFGDSFIEDIVWVSVDEAISLYEKMSDEGVSKLVKNRELPILYIVRKLGGK